MKKKLDANELGKYGIMFYNCLFLVLPSAFIFVYTGDLEKVNIFSYAIIMF